MQMSRRVAAPVAALCILVLGRSSASGQAAPTSAPPPAAAPRPVAIIDLSGLDPAAEQLAKQLSAELQVHPDLAPIPDPTLIGELIGRFEDENQTQLDAAKAAVAAAETDLGRFQFAGAASEASGGHASLHRVTPSPLAIERYADLAFAYGQARLGERAAAEAHDAFALVHRLSAGRVLDAARYLPEVVQAFEAARAPSTRAGTLVIEGAGRVWIDGKDAGTAPGEREVASGMHVVWLTGPDRETRGARVSVAPGGRAVVRIEDAAADDKLKVRRVRALLRAAPDPTARAAAMKQLAQLVRVSDAVLLSSVNGQLIVQTWRDPEPGFSALREVKERSPRELLAPLAPVREVAAPPDEPPIVIPPIVEQPRWWQRRSVQLSTAGAVVAGVAAAILYARYRPDSVQINDGIGHRQ